MRDRHAYMKNQDQNSNSKLYSSEKHYWQTQKEDVEEHSIQWQANLNIAQRVVVPSQQGATSPRNKD